MPGVEFTSECPRQRYFPCNRECALRIAVVIANRLLEMTEQESQTVAMLRQYSVDELAAELLESHGAVELSGDPLDDQESRIRLSVRIGDDDDLPISVLRVLLKQGRLDEAGNDLLALLREVWTRVKTTFSRRSAGQETADWQKDAE